MQNKSATMKHLYAIVLAQQDYSEVRKAEGCENLIDLPPTLNDHAEAIKAVGKMGGPVKNIKVFTDKGLKEIQGWWRKMTVEWTDLAINKKEEVRN